MNTVARQAASPIVSARGIVNRFGAQRVHDKLDLDVFAGEIIGIAGGSGSGKSVLLKTLIGLHRPSAGQVSIAGRPVDDLTPVEKATLIGVLFQQGALFSSLSVAQNVMLPMREHTKAPVHMQEQAAAMKLALTGLPDDSGVKRPSELSGGMVKRAALARALALDPQVLFLDEPTADLDAVTASGIDELIMRLNRNLNITVVLVTHDLATLFSVCHRVAVLVDGRLVIDTLPGLTRSRQPWVRDFLQGPRGRAALIARDANDKTGGQRVQDASRKRDHGNR